MYDLSVVWGMMKKMSPGPGRFRQDRRIFRILANNIGQLQRATKRSPGSDRRVAGSSRPAAPGAGKAGPPRRDRDGPLRGKLFY